MLILGGGAAAVYLTHREEIPYSHRTHFVLCSPSTSKRIGEMTFRQIIEAAERQQAVYPSSHPKTNLVRRVGLRLAEMAAADAGGGFVDHMKDCEWEFKVIQSPQINAAVLPGGKVVVYSGLLNILEQEDELAFVLAHEVAHVVARHPDERMTTSSLLGLFNVLFFMLFGLNIDGVLVLGLQLPFSRRSETEADLIGLQIMARSCYDPRWAPGVHRKIERAAPQTGLPTMLSTHPASKQRVSALEEAVPGAMRAYSDSDCEWR